MTWRRWLILTAALGLLLAACGGDDGTQGIASLQEDAAAGGSTTTAPAAATDPEQAMLDFTQCMRDHGIDMPDPEVNTAGGGFSFGITVQGSAEAGEPDNAEMQKMQEADAACRHFLEGMVQQFEQPDMTEMQDQMLAFSQCMRDHGVDMPDPEFSEDGGVSLIGPDAGATAFDPNDPTFQAAQEACQEIFGGNGGPMTIIGGGAAVVVGPGGATSGVVTPPPDGAVPAPGSGG